MKNSDGMTQKTESSDTVSDLFGSEAISTSVIAEVVERLVEETLEGTAKNLTASFRGVLRILNHSGGEILLMTEFRNPHLLCKSGERSQTTTNLEISQFYEALWCRSEIVGKCMSSIVGDSRVASCAFVRSKSEILVVDVWGDKRIDPEDLVLLRIFARLLNRGLNQTREFKTSTAENAESEPTRFPPGYFVGKSKAIGRVHREIETLCDSSLPILLVGETGVGKEMLAQLVHQWSDRAHGPFIAVNCAAIPAELLESEMFGIEKGVATGVHEREGYFQRARGGTLFLDEISEMSAPLQAKLLRALQEKEIQQVGGSILKADVRFIAATNSDLQQRMQDGRFRSDLYYRIAGTLVRIPPLRERKEDITPLVQHFAELYGRECGKRIVGISVPGNCVPTDA